MVDNRPHTNGGRDFHGENDNASEEYILGTGIATSTTLPLLVLSLATILLNLLLSQFYNSSTSQDDFLCRVCTTRVTYCHVTSSCALEQQKIKWDLENELVELSLSDEEQRGSHAISETKNRRESPPRSQNQSPANLADDSESKDGPHFKVEKNEILG